MAEGIFPKADGDIDYASESNYFFSKIGSIMVGSGLDVSVAGGSSIVVLFASGTVQANYLKIVAGAQCTDSGNLNGTNAEPATMRVNVAQSGTTPSYTQIYSGTLHSWHYGGGGLGANTGWNSAGLVNLELLHTLTAAQKTSGVQVQFISAAGDAFGVSGGRAFLEYA